MKYVSKGQGHGIVRFPATMSPPGKGKNKRTKTFHWSTQGTSVCHLGGFYQWKVSLSLSSEESPLTEVVI